MITDHRSAVRRRRATLFPAGAAALAALSALSLLPAAEPAAASPALPAAPSSPASEATPTATPTATPAEQRTDAYLDSIRQNPTALREFFTRMPKGGDLHNHLPGAASTEFLIELAGRDGLCIEQDSMTAVPPPCEPGQRPAVEARTDGDFHRALIRAWSMQDFPADGSGESGHDHFFATFGKFGAAARGHRGELLAEVADTVAEQNQFYLETMVTPAAERTNELADEVGWDGDDADLARMHRKLLAGGRLDRLVAQARREADDTEADRRAAGHCGTTRPAPGCALPTRFISQVARGSSPERVFTQIALGLRLAEQDERYVAVNLVEPEDGERALRDYRLHMRMLDYLHGRYPDAHITLHAGELWPGLVKPEELTFHIGAAVRTGQAERIGHGVDLRYEDDWRRLARTMAREEIPVEVPFSSNAQILGVSGDEHPFEAYRAYGVPVVLATDDPGVSRIDISHEYRHAAMTYDLSYPELKELARASLEYAFLPGRSVWRGNPTRQGYRPAGPCVRDVPGAGSPSRACARLLAGSPKAAVQWRQEAAFRGFEGRYGGATSGSLTPGTSRAAAATPR
ncbi:adenosine deaminase family protein [Streptomyces sp. NPDC002851]